LRIANLLSVLFLLRLTLVPAFIAVVTLAARKWGPRAAGFVTALPAVAGPTLGFYAVQQGPAFAANAARGSLMGLVGVAAFSAAYAHASRRCGWLTCVLIGWIAFGVVTVVALGVSVNAVTALLIAVTALLVARAVMPLPGVAQGNWPAPSWDLPLRMVSAATLVFALTAIADRLGPRLSGLLTPFPVATAIVAGFTHAQQGTAAVVRFFRGYMPALCSFAIFCFVFSRLLPGWGLPITCLAALAVQLLAQAVLIVLFKRIEQY
jgi:hypothetical protein